MSFSDTCDTCLSLAGHCRRQPTLYYYLPGPYLTYPMRTNEVPVVPATTSNSSGVFEVMDWREMCRGIGLGDKTKIHHPFPLQPRAAAPTEKSALRPGAVVSYRQIMSNKAEAALINTVLYILFNKHSKFDRGRSPCILHSRCESQCRILNT